MDLKNKLTANRFGIMIGTFVLAILFFVSFGFYNLSLSNKHANAEKPKTEQVVLPTEKGKLPTMNEVKKLVDKTNAEDDAFSKASPAQKARLKKLRDLNGETVVDPEDGCEYIANITWVPREYNVTFTPKPARNYQQIDPNWIKKHTKK